MQSSSANLKVVYSSSPLDSTHTASEQRIYSVMYRLTISRGTTERHFGRKELTEQTGIRSDYTIRKAIDGLIAKQSIEIIYYKNGDPLGPRYRIYKPDEIFTRRRSLEMEIDPQSKKIRSLSVTPATTPATTPAIFAGVPPQKLRGLDPSLLLKVLNLKINSDDDTRACAREGSSFENFLRSFFPTVTESEIQKASQEIEKLITQEMEKRLSLSKTPPVSPNYLVECIRRLCSESQSADREPKRTGKQDQNNKSSKKRITEIAKQVRQAHVGQANYNIADFSEDIKSACAREGISYDSALITEVIEGLGRKSV
jgi:hypothetical protein